jgi:hypothetical protein
VAAVTVLLCVVATVARSAPVAFSEARLVLQFGPLYGVVAPPLEAEPLTGVLDATRAGDGSLLGLTIPPSLFQASTEIALGAVSLLPAARGVALDFANGAGSFARTGSGTSSTFRGTMPLLGVHKVCLFFACGAPEVTNLSVPLDVIGAGGITSEWIVLRVALAGETWSTGSVTLDGAGGATSMVTGGISTTPAGVQQIQLVTPLMISTNAIGGDDEPVPPVRGLARLTISLAPEPGAAGVLGTAVVVLLALGANRRPARSGR